MRKLPYVFLVLILSLAFIGNGLAADQIPWGVGRIRTDLVWDFNTGSGILIAVIDTGIAYYHSDLEDRVIGGESFIGGWWWDDTQNHGTLVAGITAAIINNYGLIGVSPNVSLLAAKAIPPDNWQDIVDALYWAVDQGAQIIVMALVTREDRPEVRNACDDIYYNRNRLLIAGAGNDGGPVRYPAKYDSVIAVGAVDENDSRWVWSNYGPELELVAPGVNINSTANRYTYPFSDYMVDTGTSFAVPHVAGLAALIYASKIDPEYDSDGDGYWDNFEVRYKLRHLALDLGPAGKDDQYGWGLINAWATNQRPLGDINIDYIVDVEDLYTACLAYGSYPGHPAWNPRADINIDNFVDIEDINIIANNYGKVDP